jgi:hypothetical protein
MPYRFFAARFGNNSGTGTAAPSITLSVRDNGDGSGAVATIAGSVGGSTNTVYVASLNPVTGLAGPFVAHGSRTGDGPVSLALAPGTWLGYDSDASGSGLLGVSPPAVFLTTKAGAPPDIYVALVQAVQTQLGVLNLTLDGATVPQELRKKLGVGDGFAGNPQLVIVATGRERQERFFAQTWWYTFNVLVALVSAGRLEIAVRDLTGELGAYLDWREALANRIKQPTLLGLPYVGHVSLEYDPVLDEGDIERGWDVSAIKFGFRCLVDTGLSP